MKKNSVTTNLDWILTNKKTSILLLFCRDRQLLKRTILGNGDGINLSLQEKVALSWAQRQRQISREGVNAEEDEDVSTPFTSPRQAVLSWHGAWRAGSRLPHNTRLQQTWGWEGRMAPAHVPEAQQERSASLTHSFTTTDTGAPTHVPWTHKTTAVPKSPRG